jgi:outer membrane receptor for ferrienterochelin and colicins
MSFDHRFNETSSLNIRNSISHFNRFIAIPGYMFDGTQQATFSEISYTGAREESEWVAGVNLWTDNFSEKPVDALSTQGLPAGNIWCLYSECPGDIATA